MQMQHKLGDWFVFNKSPSRTMMKSGSLSSRRLFVIWSKRLEPTGTSPNVTGDEGKIGLNAAALQCLIDGYLWQKGKQNKRHNSAVENLCV